MKRERGKKGEKEEKTRGEGREAKEKVSVEG